MSRDTVTPYPSIYSIIHIARCAGISYKNKRCNIGSYYKKSPESPTNIAAPVAAFSVAPAAVLDVLEAVDFVPVAPVTVAPPNVARVVPDAASEEAAALDADPDADAAADESANDVEDAAADADADTLAAVVLDASTGVVLVEDD
jgi:hypothetical protein